MSEKTLDAIMLEAIKKRPSAYAITPSEYESLINADFIINSVTKEYVAIDDVGNSSVIVTTASPREIIKAFKKGGVDAKSLKELTIDVFKKRKWYTTLVKVDNMGQVELDYYILLNSDNERREIKYSDIKFGEHAIIDSAKDLKIPPQYGYIPPFAWEALKQIAIIFEREGAEQSLIIPSQFRTIRQGQATNALTKISTSRSKQIEVDRITGLATIQRGGLTVNIADYVRKGIKLKASTHRLLDAITVKFTESGAKSPTVHLPLKEYMALCGLTDEKEARNRVKEDLEALYSLTISFRGKGKSALDFVDCRLCDYKGIVKGTIIFNYSQPFYGILKQYPIMRLHNEYFKINAKRNPNSAYFLRKISELKNMNATDSNEDIIAVQTLLDSTDELPKYSDVVAKGQIDQRIKTPFERDLDALSNVIKWEYCHRKGMPLTDEELANMDYSLFSKLLIKIKWVEYPEEVAEKARERKAIAQAKAAAPKKRGRPRKQVQT